MNKFLAFGLIALVGLAAFGFYQLNTKFDGLTGSVGSLVSALEGLVRGKLGTSPSQQTGPAQFYDSVYIAAEGELNLSLITVTTTTIPTSATDTTAGRLKAADICSASLIAAQLPSGGVTLTLPSSSAMFSRCLSHPGDVHTFAIQNNNALSGSFTVAVNDQSSTLRTLVQTPTSTATVNATTSLNYSDIALFKAIRGVTSSVTAAGSSTPWLYWVESVVR